MPGHVHSFYTQRQFIQTRAKGLRLAGYIWGNVSSDFVVVVR
jgi:hypothetical protein